MMGTPGVEGNVVAFGVRTKVASRFSEFENTA